MSDQVIQPAIATAAVLPPFRLALARCKQNGFATYGRLTSAHGSVPVISLVTLELPWRNNAPNISCVPAGVYVMELYNSPEHGWCFRLVGVPGRSDVELHIGCLPRDSRGCILLGIAFGYVDYADGRPNASGDGITSSGIAFTRFMAAMRGITRASLTITDVPPNAEAA